MSAIPIADAANAHFRTQIIPLAHQYVLIVKCHLSKFVLLVNKNGGLYLPDLQTASNIARDIDNGLQDEFGHTPKLCSFVLTNFCNQKYLSTVWALVELDSFAATLQNNGVWFSEYFCKEIKELTTEQINVFIETLRERALY